MTQTGSADCDYGMIQCCVENMASGLIADVRGCRRRPHGFQSI